MKISEVTLNRLERLAHNFPIPENHLGLGIDNEDYLEMAKNLGRTFPDAFIAFGASKIAIVFNDSEPVIKIPFHGVWFEEQDLIDYNYDADELYHNDRNLYFVPFYNANIKDGWDYCRTEVINYNYHASQGLEMFFAEEQYWGKTDNGVPLYIQEKVNSVWEIEVEGVGDIESLAATPQSLGKARKRRYSTTNPYHDIDARIAWEEWLALAIDKYGDDVVKNFVEYIDGRDFMDDMHRRNYGLRADGTPCVLDYSGYYEDF